MGGWGGWGGVITSCEVRWMMLNPGRCCLVGRCCYVASFVVVYRRGVGGCNNVMWSALDDVESWKMLLGWKMLLRCKFRMVSMFHTSLVINGRCKIFLFQHGQTSSSSAMKMEVRLIDQTISEKNIKHCKAQCKNNIFHRQPCQNFFFGKAKMKNMWCSFRPWFSSGLWHFVLINKNWKMYETAIPMGKMLNAFLAIHGRCKFIIFLRGQTPSLSAPTLILSLMEHFQRQKTQ